MIAHGRLSCHGRPAAWIAADVIRFEDGKVAEHWDVLQEGDPSRVGQRTADVLRPLPYMIF